MIQMKVEGNGLEILEQRINKIQLKDIADICLREVVQNVKDSKNWDGSAMRELKAETIKTKERAGSVAQNTPLVFKGGLLGFFKTKRISDNEIHIINTGKSRNYFTNKTIPSAEVLTYQKDKGRRPMGFTKTALEKVRKYLLDPK